MFALRLTSAMGLLCAVCAAGLAQVDTPPMDVLYQSRLVAESSRCISINLFNVPIDHAKAEQPAQFTIVSDDDPNYAQAKQAHPTRSGSRTRSIRVPLRKKMLVKATVIFLELPEPMKNGSSYRVTVGDIGAQVPALDAVPFDDRKQISDNIRVNQIGYLPNMPKFAYIGQYMGSAGGMPVEAKEFELLDARGKVAFTGQVVRRNVNEQLVGQQVYELDFTSFNTPGAYRLRVPGIGLSYDFEIGDDALNPSFTNLMRGHYHQRCGMAIEGPYSRHVRPACHLDDAAIDQKAESLKFVNAKNPPLYPTRYGRMQQATHGHHDAGDYGKYTISGTDYVFSALNAMEVFPGKFDDDQCGLPYSGNRIPDLVEEVKWELDWLENMQDPDDGGVFGVIKPNTGGYEQALPAPKAGRFFYPKDTVFTAAYAGALAHAASSPVMKKYYPRDCARYLDKAKKAWEFLEKNDRFVHYFHYGALFDDWDERCWAAAALYRATGDQKYHRAFLDQFDPSKKHWGWWPLTGTVGNAAYTYLFMKDRERDQAMTDRCRKAVTEACAKFIREGDAHPYRLSMPTESITHGAYGWYFPGAMFGYNLLMGYALDQDEQYLQCALNNLDYEMGANPFGYCQQTGLGSKRNIEVVDNESSFDNIIEPVPGIPLGIGSQGFYWLNMYGRTPGEGQYPKDWPLLNRWYDGFNVNTEFTTGPLMRETIVAAYFADPSPRRRTRPTVRIIADRRVGTAPLTVHFRIQATTPGGRVRQVFWDFDDETFSIQPSPTHRFDDAGRQYQVAVTIIDDRGVSAIDTIRIGVQPKEARYPRETFQPDGNTLMLLHLDGDLTDASAQPMKVSRIGDDTAPPAFDDDPLWMAEPAGKCLKLSGDEQFEVTIPRAALGDAVSTPLTMEMMVYVESFSGWGVPGNPILLGLEDNWNSRLVWQQGTWDQKRAPAFGGGSGSIVSSDEFAKSFPLRQWCHVKITYDGKGKAAFSVNDKLRGDGSGDIFRADRKNDLVFRFGTVRGMIDEVRISKVVR